MHQTLAREGIVLQMWKEGPPYQGLPDCVQEESHEGQAARMTCPTNYQNRRGTSGQQHRLRASSVQQYPENEPLLQ